LAPKRLARLPIRRGSNPALVTGAVGHARRKDQLARVAHHRHALGLTWAAATVVALMLMGAAGGVLYETQTAPQERGIVDRPY
jgi:hypothetical protein